MLKYFNISSYSTFVSVCVWAESKREDKIKILEFLREDFASFA